LARLESSCKRTFLQTFFRNFFVHRKFRRLFFRKFGFELKHSLKKLRRTLMTSREECLTHPPITTRQKMKPKQNRSRRPPRRMSYSATRHAAQKNKAKTIRKSASFGPLLIRVMLLNLHSAFAMSRRYWNSVGERQALKSMIDRATMLLATRSETHQQQG
jgi:hypothetical protein